MAKNNKKEGLSEDTKTIITVLLLVFAFPIGVILMWFWMKWPVWVKVLISLLLIIPLLFVVGIISSIVLLTTAIKPNELALRARDAARLQDLVTIQEHINNVTAEGIAPGLLCSGEKAPCIGDTTDSNVNLKQTDGTGWVKISLPSLSMLPVDPVNNTSYSYTYCSDGKEWEIQARVESKQVLEKAAKDGGDEDDQYEVGSNLTLCNLFY